MASEVFNRYEKKYLLDDKTYCSLVTKISEYMEPDKYNLEKDFYTISNIYYDTRDDKLINRSLEKPMYKEKLRLRAYGTPKIDDMVFLEIKKKYNGIVNKRRADFSLLQAYEFMNSRNLAAEAFDDNQVVRELKYFKKMYELEPKVYIAYDRKAFYAKDNPDFRLTFDTNIRTRREDLRLELGDYGESLLEDGIWLMEVKIKDAMPLWFAEILSELRIYPVSFSKYGTEYKKYFNCKLGGNTICLSQYLAQYQQMQELQQMAQ